MAAILFSGSAGRRWSLAVAVGLAAMVAGLAAPGASFAISTLSLTSISIGPVEGQQFSGPVATVVDSEGADLASAYTATIEWGDGTTQSGIVTVSAGEIAVSGSHIYAEEGTFTVGVAIEDSEGGFNGSAATTITVPDAPLTAPLSQPMTFTGAGIAPSNASLNAFEAGIGGANNGTSAGERQAGFRRVNWDGIALDGSTPGTSVISPGKTVSLPAGSQQERGLELDSPLAVSGDGFASINPAAAGLFTPFSSANLAAPFNTNVLALNVVSPSPAGGTPTSAATRGLGVVFLNVELPNTTSVEYLDGEIVLGKFFAPVGGHDQPSFLGVLYASPLVTRVVITLGTAEILNFNGSFASAGLVSDGFPNNLVAADDVILAEPAPDRPTLSATAGASFSGTLATFADANPNANAEGLLATVDWGDGARTAGVIAPGAAGQFTVSGTHTYAQAGSFPVTIAVRDLGGAHVTLHATAVVTPIATAPIGIGIVPITTPSPTPLPLPPPHCTLAASSPALSRVHLGAGARATARAAKSRKHRIPPPPSRLRAVVSCDQQTSVELTATATLTAVSKKGQGHKATVTMLALGLQAATLAANQPTRLAIEVAKTTLAKLRAAAARHQRISVVLALTATNTHGSSRTTASVTSLRL